MAKITTEQIKKYREVNANGFRVNLNQLLFGYSDGKPKLERRIFESEDKVIDIEIDFYKLYRGSFYTISVKEAKVSGNFLVSGSGYWSKKIFEESAERFNFKYMQKLADIVTDEMIADLINEYQGRTESSAKRDIMELCRQSGGKGSIMEITSNSEHIEIEGYKGSWYVIDCKNHMKYGMIFLLEHEMHGDEVPCLIVNKNSKILADEVYNGLEEIDY